LDGVNWFNYVVGLFGVRPFSPWVQKCALDVNHCLLIFHFYNAKLNVEKESATFKIITAH